MDYFVSVFNSLHNSPPTTMSVIPLSMKLGEATLRLHNNLETASALHL